jgi:hypothetical protein
MDDGLRTCAVSAHMEFLLKAGKGERETTFRTTTYPAAKANGGQQHVVEAEDERMRVERRSASPAYMVKLANC